MARQNYATLQAKINKEIEKLQKQASEIKTKEFAATVKEIQAKMQAFGITVKDIQVRKPGKPGRVAKVKAPKAAKASRKAGVPVAAKYRGPNGETWSGRGLTPKWLAALVAQGQSKESFAVSPAAN